MEARSKLKNIGQRRVERLEFLNLRIRSVTVLNNTPAFLYISQDAQPARNACLWQVEPFTLMTVPCDFPESLYIVDGELIAPLDNNAKASIFWSEESAALSVERVRRNVEYVIAKNGTASTYTIRALTLPPAPAPTPGGLQAQSTFGTASSVQDAREYVLPGFATHRTLFAQLDGAATFDAGTRLEGRYGDAWRPLLELPTGKDWLAVNLTDMALPENVRLVVVSSAPSPLNAVIRFDL